MTAQTTQTHHLDEMQRYLLERARQALEASRAETDPGEYARHCGRLEVARGQMVALVGELAGGPGNTGPGA